MHSLCLILYALSLSLSLSLSLCHTVCSLSLPLSLSLSPFFCGFFVVVCFCCLIHLFSCPLFVYNFKNWFCWNSYCSSLISLHCFMQYFFLTWKTTGVCDGQCYVRQLAACGRYSLRQSFFFFFFHFFFNLVLMKLKTGNRMRPRESTHKGAN